MIYEHRYPTTSVDVSGGRQTTIRLRTMTVVSVDGDHERASLTLSPGRWHFAEEKHKKKWTIRAALIPTEEPT